MSEMWIRPDTTSAYLIDITPPGYILYQQPSEVCRGGLGFFVKDGLDQFIVPSKTSPSLKISSSRYPYTKNLFYFLNIYRPPSSSSPTFFKQFHSVLEDIHRTTENLVIIGNFNFHLETTCSNLKTFHSLIDSFNLIQEVDFYKSILVCLIYFYLVLLLLLLILKYNGLSTATPFHLYDLWDDWK